MTMRWGVRPACWVGLALFPLFAVSGCSREPVPAAAAKSISATFGPYVLPFRTPFDSRNTAEQLDLVRKFLDAKDRGLPPEDLDIGYPIDGSIFPPEIVAPVFMWENSGMRAKKWLIEFSFQDSGKISVLIPTQAPLPYRFDKEINPEGKPVPLERPEDIEMWEPSGELWGFIKGMTVEKDCRLSITGFTDSPDPKPLRAGAVRFKTSRDPVGAPIFYRDVPFIPTVNQRAETILPLAGINMRYILWRLRDVSRSESKVILKDMPTCANCHTFTKDGKWLGMDIDGTFGDKGAYGIQKVSRQMVYDRSDVISWNYDYRGWRDGRKFNDRQDGRTLGFLSSISPDGDFVVTTLNEKLYSTGFKDPAFSQVFYPTRGILAFYSKATGVALALPGADDSAFVHCSPTWTPDGKAIIFSRAKARDPYTPNQKLPARANDPEETQIQYDLYRIPFNGGLGGKAEPIKGASFNGMSNSFAKVTPDNRFLIWVQCRNGLLMRPDSKLWIAPVAGGAPRLMNCNTPLMNSWHSISPNGRWMVFSSKAFSPFTQLFLTHLDGNGMDSPYILLPNSTADNRAANLPEFANIRYDDLDNIDAPAVSHYRDQFEADRLIKSGSIDSGIKVLRRALSEETRDRAIRSELMVTLAEWVKDPDESARILEDAIRNDSNYSEMYLNMGVVLEKRGKNAEAITAYRKTLTKDSGNFIAMIQLAKLHMGSNPPGIRNLPLSLAYAQKANAITYFRKARLLEPLARVLSELGRFDEAAEKARAGIPRALDIGDTAFARQLEAEAQAFSQRRAWVPNGI